MNTSFRSLARRPAAVILPILVVGCASLGLDAVVAPRFNTVDEPGSTLRLLPPSASRPAGGVSLRLWTRVENPNPIGLTVSEVAGQLFLEDAPIEVTFPLGLPLEAGGDTVTPLDLTVGFEALPRLAEIAGRALVTGDPVSYRIEGTIGVDAGYVGTPRFGPATILRGELQPLR